MFCIAITVNFSITSQSGFFSILLIKQKDVFCVSGAYNHDKLVNNSIFFHNVDIVELSQIIIKNNMSTIELDVKSIFKSRGLVFTKWQFIISLFLQRYAHFLSNKHVALKLKQINITD